MIRRTTLTLAVALLAAAWLGAGAAAPARASLDGDMRESIMALRGLIDRKGAEHFFVYPSPDEVRPGLLGAWWPSDPWAGGPLRPGTGQGRYQYSTTPDRRHYRLIGYLGGGGRITVRGGIPREVVLAYDHRGEEGLNLIRQYVEDWAAEHDGLYPLPADVAADGAVGTDPVHRYWPSNPWNHNMMRQRDDPGSFAYEVAPDRLTYTLRLHRALKHDYVLTGADVTSPWQRLLTGLEDEILRRSARVLAGYVAQWARHHGGSLPDAAVLAPGTRLAAAHPHWPRSPVTGAVMHPGTTPGDYTYAPGSYGTYRLTIHLHSGDFKTGGSAASAMSPAPGSGSPES
jgi:hypothetical protein